MGFYFNILLTVFGRRHERIHTKKGGHMKSPTDLEQVDDLATLEVLDEVSPWTLAVVKLPLNCGICVF